ncbi:MAG: SHOCT domain-containing protein [Phycisphaerales bacterium]|nr:MAG: SHOCT domain-containing protein [Phycisphaerales bacterium]
MRYRTFARPYIAIILMLMSSVDAFSARIKSLTLCLDVTEGDLAARNVRETFEVDTPEIHAVILLEDVKAKSVLKGSWISVDAISVPNYEIDSYQVQFQENGPATAHVALSKPNNGWPAGNYRFDVYVDGELMGSKSFAVTAATTGDESKQVSETLSSQSQEQIDKQLQALEAAHNAGILSEEEYSTKKAGLEARLRVLQQGVNPETQKKLEALESAFKAGILTEQEYEQKKALLIGGPSQTQSGGRRQLPTPDRTAGEAGTGMQVTRRGKIHRHPAGFSFWHPESWNVMEQDGSLQLVPTDAVTTVQGPVELYFMAAESTAGQDIQKPDDPRLVEYLDGQVKSLSPLLQHVGKTSAFETEVGQGAVLDWKATSPDGKDISARVFVTFVRQNVVMLVGMGLRERIEARDRDLRDIVKSVSLGQAVAPSVSPAGAPAEGRQARTDHQQPNESAVTVNRQQQALEAARQAGVLSEQEFLQKKKELEGGHLQVADVETRKKLDALDSAYSSGVLSEAEYKQKRAQLTGRSPGAGAKQDARASGKIEGQTYRHVIGFSFWYPASWTVKELEDTLQLIPPDPGKTPAGEPTELYFILGDSVAGEGIYNPYDPRVVQHMDQVVSSISPFLKRTGAPAPIKMTNSQGAVMNWEGKSPRGDLVCSRAYVSIIKDHGVALLGLCFKERLEARDADLRRIFASFSLGSGQLDPQLFGQWSFLTTQSITNWSPFETDYSRAQLASDTTGTLVFRPDGTWMRTDRTQMIAGAGGVWLESNETDVSKGRWYAGSGALYLIWEDNSWQDYKYQLRGTGQGARLLLVSGEKGELWKRAE